MNTRHVFELLQEYESRNITFIEPDGSWPIVWERARGVHVWDAEGRKRLDLTAAFGVAAAGHANQRVIRAAAAQLARLPHAMGDVHPHAPKAALARELSRLTFERWSRNLPLRFPARARTDHGKTIFCNAGFEAVEAALKTAMLATGKPGVVAFEGAYHGLGYGALNATHRSHFRSRFKRQLGNFGHFIPFPKDSDGEAALRKTGQRLDRLLGRGKIGAVLVEPIQVRGGINIPDIEFLNILRAACDDHGALLIVDEIYTGFGRTGRWFACEHSATVPDIICLGKALTGGFPLSACVGRGDIMDAAWPAATGEAIHTSTFLGHPVGCAMALAQIREITTGRLAVRSARTGDWLLRALGKLSGRRGKLTIEARGLGLLAGIEITKSGRPATDAAMSIIKSMLRRGFILLPEGEFSNVISFSPPLTITGRQLGAALRALEAALSEVQDS